MRFDLEQRLQVLRVGKDLLSRAVELLLTFCTLCSVLLLHCALFFLERLSGLFSLG